MRRFSRHRFFATRSVKHHQFLTAGGHSDRTGQDHQEGMLPAHGHPQEVLSEGDMLGLLKEVQSEDVLKTHLLDVALGLGQGWTARGRGQFFAATKSPKNAVKYAGRI